MADDQITRRKFVRNATVAGAAMAAGVNAAQGAPKASQQGEINTRSHSKKMEYRRLGKTDLMISAVSLGGHWKNIHTVIPDVCQGGHWLSAKLDDPRFEKSRHDVVSACIECGINYIDACTEAEVLAHAKALRGRRDAMYLGFSFYEHDMRFAEWQTTEKLLESLHDLMRRAKLDYVDLWRPTCYWTPKDNHTEAHELAMIEAFDKAKRAGEVRFTGLSTHKHDWAIRMLQTYPEHVQAVVVPYTAGSKKAHARVDPGKGGWVGVPEDPNAKQPNIYSLIDVVKQCDAGWIGIKPFAAGSVFKSHGVANSATKEEDDERARLTLRYVLSNDALTAAIPGMITPDQVHNAAQAVAERRQLDLAESRRLQRAVDQMWANLPQNYQWLREWEHV